MEWCGVSKATAAAWKKGTRKPSRRAVRLFSLFAQQKVLPDEFEGWKFNRAGDLVTPEGSALTQGMIRAIPLLYQQISALKCELREAKGKIENLEIELDPAAHTQVLIDSSRNVVRFGKR